MRRKRTRSAMWGRAIVTLCALLMTATMSFAARNKVAPDLQQKSGAAQVDVIVQFDQPLSARMHKKVFSRGGSLKRELGVIRSGAYHMPGSKVADLAKDPDVVYITPDRKLRSLGTSSGQGLDYHTDAVNAPAAWTQGLYGAGVGVAVIDSGIATVSDLTQSNVVYSQDFVGDNGGSATDLYGHGTHVSGIIAGNGANSTGPAYSYTFQGIAPQANLINLRVLDANGASTDSEVIAAIDTAIQLQSTYNIRVINLSLGRGVYESYTQDPLCQAVEQAWQAGIVVVVSAGNDGRNNNAGTNGYGTIEAPANDPYVITVGAMNTEGTPDRSDDLPASYSSKGPTLGDLVMKPDLVAPGNLVVSLYTPAETLNQEYSGNEVPLSAYQSGAGTGMSPSYFVLSGTSMAAPMVSATAALMIEQNPSLTPDQIKARLMETAFKGLQNYGVATDPTTGNTYDVESDAFTVGAGYLDIGAALANTDLAPAGVGSAMSPFVTYDSSGNVVLINGTPVSGASVVWGNGAWTGSVVWGGSLSGTNSAGQTVVWASGTGNPDTVIWGGSTGSPDTVIWGGSTGNPDTVIWGGSTGGPDTVIWGGSTGNPDTVIWGGSTGNPDTVIWGGSTGDPDTVIWGGSTSTGDSSVLVGDKPQ